MPRLSIIIPFYNSVEYLSECVGSILVHNLDDYEIILVDDGSTDDSVKISDDFASKIFNIRVFHKENGGVSTARNLGIDKAEGEYIMFVDSDDTLSRDWGKIFDEEWKSDIVYIDKRLGEESVESMRTHITGYPSTKIYIPGPTSKLFRREFLIQNNLKFTEKINFAEDLLFNLESIIKAESVGVIKEGIYEIRKTSGGLTRGFDENIFESTIRFMRRIDELDLGVEGDYLKQIQIFNLATRISRLDYKTYLRCTEVFGGLLYKEVLNSKYVVQLRFRPFLRMLKKGHFRLAYRALRMVVKITGN